MDGEQHHGNMTVTMSTEFMATMSGDKLVGPGCHLSISHLKQANLTTFVRIDALSVRQADSPDLENANISAMEDARYHRFVCQSAESCVAAVDDS